MKVGAVGQCQLRLAIGDESLNDGVVIPESRVFNLCIDPMHL